MIDDEELKRLQDKDQIAFRYVDHELSAYGEANVNGSTDAIAGVLSEKGNVLGLMPHPERATREMLGSSDGLQILRAFQLVNV